MSSTQWVVPADGLCLLSFRFQLWYQSTDDDSLVNLGTVVYETSKTDIVSIVLPASYFRYVVPSLRGRGISCDEGFHDCTPR